MKLNICKECNCEVTNSGFAFHLYAKHKMYIKDYYDKRIKKETEGFCANCGKPTKFRNMQSGYDKYCSHSCRMQFIKTDDKRYSKQCLCCGIELYSTSPVMLGRMLNRHLKSVHKIDNKEYYDKYMKTENEGICRICGKPTKFVNLTDGYRVFCSKKCNCLAVQRNNALQREEVKNIKQEKKIESYREEDKIEAFQNELKEDTKQYDKEKKILYHAFETSPIYFQEFKTETDWC